MQNMYALVYACMMCMMCMMCMNIRVCCYNCVYVQQSSCGEWDATEINGNFKVIDKPIDRTTTQTLTSATKVKENTERN